jgi:hypothetical protein
MAEPIGSPISGLTTFNINTQIPSLTDNADIQEALRLYHFGQPTGSGVGFHDPSDTNAASLVNPSIAYSLYSLQQQVTAAVAGSGVSGSTWTAKGSLVSATGPSAPTVLSVGTAGQVLTVNLGTSTGLQWVSPEVTLANAVTLTSKTLTAPKMSSTFIADANGNELISFPAAVTSAVNEITVTNAITSGKPTISATGGDTDVTLNLVSKGTGTVQVNGLDIATVTGTQTLTNKTLSNPTITNNLYLFDNNSIVFEGSSADAFETTFGVINPTVDRTINLPNVDGTVITSGNLTDITSVGTLSSLAVTGNAVSHIAFNDFSVGSYTLTLSDDGKIVTMPTLSTLTVPTNSSVPFLSGSQVTVVQTGAGQVTLAGATVVTGTYLSGGAAAATTVSLSTYRPTFQGLALSGTGFSPNTVADSPTTATIATGTYYFGGANGSTSVLIREYRPLVIANVLLTGTNIALNTLVTSTTNTTTDTATYHSGGASSATTVVVKERLPLVIAGQRLSATGLTGNQTVSSIAETSITTAVYNSGGASGASTIIVASNANIFVGQRVTGTGITGNVYVSSFSTGATTTITLGQSPVVSGIGTVSYTAYTLNAQASGTYTFFGATITFATGANAQISGAIAITGTTVNFSPATTGQASGTQTFSASVLGFSPPAASQISGTITGSVLISATPGLKLRAQNSSCTLIKYTADKWFAFGDLIA